MAVAQADGSVILEARIDTDQVIADISKIKAAAQKASDIKLAERLEREFNKAVEGAQKAQQEIAQIYARLDEVSANAFKAPDTGEPVYLREEQAEIEKLTARLGDLEQSSATATNRAAALSSEIGNLASRASEADESMQMRQVPAALESVGKSIEKTASRITGLIKRVFIFSMITRLLRSVREELGNVLMSNESFRNSLYTLKAALRTAFQPILETIVPAVQTLVNWLAVAATAIGRFIAAISGRSYADMAAAAKSTKAQADAYAQTSKNASGAAKSMKKVTDEAKKQLAAFDDLNILTSETDSDTGGGGGGALADAAQASGTFDTGEITESLATLMEVAGGALAAIGLILLFTGNIGWGIGAIIAGLAVFSVAEASLGRFGTEDAETTLARFGEVVGGALFVIGVILLMFGKIALGIGAMVAGAAMFGVSQAVLQRGGVKTEIDKFMKDNENIIAGSAILALILGIVILALGGGTMLPIGLGLVALGAGVLASEIALNEGTIPEKISKFLDDNLGLIVGVASAMLVLGIILVAAGVTLPLGISLIAIGATMLASEVAVHWDAISNKISEVWNTIWGFMSGWGALILGVILTVSGVAFPLGIALIAAGAGSLAKAQDPTWNAIVDKVAEVWGKVKSFWNKNIAPIFTAQWWANLGKTALNGLIGVFERALNFIIDMVNSFIGGINSVIGSVGDLIGVDLNIPKISRVQIPRLAQGAVIPPNSEFLAVLGDQKRGVNIETPLDTMIQAFETALDRRGGGASGQSTVILEIDGREFGRAAVKFGNNETRRVGTRMVIA